MTATNHGLIGIVLGAYLPLPIAVPVALISHFILDALPHYGIAQNKRNTSVRYKRIVIIDTFIALSFAVLAASQGKWSLFIVGWVAYSPDIMWVVSYFRHHKNLRIKITNPIMRFHKNIQRYERPWGAYVELALLAVTLPISLYNIFN